MAEKPSSFEEFIRYHDLVVPLSGVYSRFGQGLEELFSIDHQPGFEIPPGLSRSVLDVMSRTLTHVDAVMPWESLRVESLLARDEIAALDGTRIEKAMAITEVMTDVAEEVADIVWEKIYGEDPASMLSSEEHAERRAELEALRNDFVLLAQKELGLRQ